MQLKDSPHPLEHDVEVLDAVPSRKRNVQRVHHVLVNNLLATTDGSKYVIVKLSTHLLSKLKKNVNYDKPYVFYSTINNN